MNYFYLKNKEKIGPLTIEELKSEKLNDNTLIWYKGLEKWTHLKNLNDLKNVLNQKEELKYFLLINQEKKGPFYLDDFKDNNLQPNSLVWTKKLNEWTKAKDILELENYIMPEIPNELNQGEDEILNKKVEKIEQHKEKYNYNTTKNTNVETSKHKNDKYVDNSGGYLKRPLSHKGRIDRGEYFFLLFFAFLGVVFLSGISGSLDPYSNEYLILLFLIIFIQLFLYYFVIVTTAKRCHDVGNSGWYQLIPFYAFILLFIPGNDGDNKWGTKP
jgi:uncharacterized membrane protein YhaH (DUF805 family)